MTQFFTLIIMSRTQSKLASEIFCVLYHKYHLGFNSIVRYLSDPEAITEPKLFVGMCKQSVPGSFVFPCIEV